MAARTNQINLSPITLKVGLGWMVLGIIYALITNKGFRKQPPSFKDI